MHYFHNKNSSVVWSTSVAGILTVCMTPVRLPQHGHFWIFSLSNSSLFYYIIYRKNKLQSTRQPVSPPLSHYFHIIATHDSHFLVRSSQASLTYDHVNLTIVIRGHHLRIIPCLKRMFSEGLEPARAWKSSRFCFVFVLIRGHHLSIIPCLKRMVSEGFEPARAWKSSRFCFEH